MKFNTNFTTKLQITDVYDDERVKVKILEASIDYDLNTCYAYGKFYRAYIGDIFKCDAYFVKSEKYNFVIKTNNIPELEVPSEKKSLAKYVSSQIKGVSSKTVEKVYDTIGSDFIGTIINNPEIMENCLIKDSQKESIIKWCKDHAGFNKIAGEFYLHGFTPNEVIELYKTYGFDVVNIANTNPYIFFYQGFSRFTLCDKMFLLKHSENDLYRVSAIVYNTMKYMETCGDMAVKTAILKELVESVNNILNLQSKPNLDNIEASVKWLIENKYIIEFKLKDENYYSFPENKIIEKSIANFIKDRLTKVYMDEEKIRSLCNPELLERQKDAIVRCLTNKISIITGGPGTGKTYTIRNMIQVAKQLNPNLTIALMAPTGKAASRMIELINQEATTIHAKLGLSENDDLFNTEALGIDEDLVVIDEASMIDEKLFYCLSKHLSEKSQIVLVGDSGQLPSVGAGNLLEELLKIVPSTELIVTKRTGVAILEGNAQKIRKRKVDSLVFDDKYFSFYESSNDKVVEEIVDTYNDLLILGQRPMILAPQYSGPGVDVINARIQQMNPEEEKIFDGVKFKIGDRVICTKNTKELKIHNGDQGEILSFGQNGVNVLFDNTDEEIFIKDTKILKLAYCITAHKSQGSESKITIMVFSPYHVKMLSNKLIYTAITRAKERFIGIGSKEVFIQGCLNSGRERISLISDFYDKEPF